MKKFLIFVKKEILQVRGWGIDGEFNEENQNNYKKALKIEGKSTKGFSSTMNAIQSMKQDDLIWTRKGNIYYICRVLNNEKYHFPKNKIKFEQYKNSLKNKDKFKNFTYEDAKENDIWHLVECDYCKVGTEEEIMGCIVNSFKSRRCYTTYSSRRNWLKKFFYERI